MGRENLTSCILALVAILAIVAGNLIPVTGRQNFLTSLPKRKEYTEGTSNSSTSVPPASFTRFDSIETASWSILNNVDGIISLQCKDEIEDLGKSTLYPQNALTHSFPITAGVTDPHQNWYCSFTWDSVSGPMEQNFDIWSYFTCADSCAWKVQNDGFYFQQSADGEFKLQWKWIPWTGRRNSLPL